MSSSSFPIDAAQLVGLYMQCICYGMVLITVAYGLRVLLWSHDGHLKGRARINLIIVGATIAMFTIATLEMAFGLQHNLEAFIYYTGPGGAKGEFADISNWVNVMRTADYVAQTFIGDGIMAYRCYIVYGRNWKIVVLPVLLWLAETACGWVVVYIEATLHTAATLNESRLVPFITTLLSLTLAMTTMTTGLIVYRILKINSGVTSRGITRFDGGDRKLTRVVRILIESGLIYTVSVIVFFCTFLTSNNAQYGVSDVVVQLIPISFTLVLIRADQDSAANSSTVHLSTIQKPMSFALRSGIAGADLAPGSGISRSDVSGDQGESHMMHEMGGDRDEWKAGQLDFDTIV